MSTLKVGAIQSTTGNAAMTVANTGVTTFSNHPLGTNFGLVKLVTLNLSNAADATISSTYINSTYK